MGLRQLFDALKDPDSETISMHTFIKLAKDYGEDDGMSENELRYLLEKTQLGGDELTFEEFNTIMKGGGSTSSKSNVSMRSYEAYNNKKKESPLSNITSQDMNNSKKEIENENENEKDNANYNEEEININNMRSPEKSISIIKNNINNHMDFDSFEKGINQIKLETQEEPEKKEENIKVEKKEEINIEKKGEKPIKKYNRFRKYDNNNNN